MSSVETFFDESQGHRFYIEVRQHANGFTYQIAVHGLSGVTPGDNLFESLEKVRHAARLHAGRLIEQMVKSQLNR